MKRQNIFLIIIGIVLFSATANAQIFSKELDLNITAPSNLDLNSQFTVVFDVNSDVTNDLTDNVDFNDLSVFYTTTELQRRVEKNGTDARIYFKIPEGLTIPGATSDTGFSIKYASDVNISNPPINDANVFQRFFDFNGTVIPPNIDSNNAVQDGTIQLVDGEEAGNSFFFVSDLNFSTNWGAVIEADLNTGPRAGGVFGWNDNTATTEPSMIYGMVDNADIGTITFVFDSNTFGGVTSFTFFRLRSIPKVSSPGAFFSYNPLTTFDYNVIHQTFVGNQQIVRGGVSVVPDNNTRVEYDNLKLYYDVNWAGGTISIADVNNLSVAITATPSQGTLDPENSINSVTVDLNSTITKSDNVTVTDFNWFVDSVQISTDSDTQHIFTSAGDFNVTLIVDGNFLPAGTVRSQVDLNYLVRKNAQAIDINFSRNNFVNNADINFSVSIDPTQTINFAVWGGDDIDVNLTGTDVNFTYTKEGIKQVCVVVNVTGDLNKVACKDFVSVRFLIKTAIDEETSASLTPTLTTFNFPAQSYSHNADINVFAFYGSETQFDANGTFLIDFNDSYFPRTYFFDLDKNQTFFTLQPRLALVANSISSTIFTIDNFTRDTVPGIVIESIRTINATETIIESTVSDQTGTATMSFLVDVEYTLRFRAADGTILSEGQLGPKSTTLFAFIGTGLIVFTLEPQGEIFITWIPNTSSIDANKSTLLRLNQLITQVDLNILRVTVRVTQNDSNFFAQDFNFTGADTNIFFDVNILDANAFSFLVVTVIAQTTDGNFSKQFSYILILTGEGNIIKNLRNMKTELGATIVLMLAIIITFFVVAGFGMTVGTDMNSIGVVALLSLGIFTYLEWIPFDLYLIAILISSGGLIYRWVR